ncbi:MAG: hypothetical protein MJ179_06870 [Treponema sp.]|nr:hypothetical protein [Treponema sp.]
MIIKKNIKVVILLFLAEFLIACSCNKHEDDFFEVIEKAIEETKDMKLRELESLNSESLFELYKQNKIQLIRKSLRGESIEEESEELIKITYEFNRQTIDSEYFFYLDSGIIKNQYLEKFNNELVKNIIEYADEDDFFDVSKLKIIYEY